MNVLVIGNPVAGGGRAGREGQRLVTLLRERGHRVEWFPTRGRGDARQRAASLGAGATDRIAVVGGDGTLNEVLNGLPDPSRIPIAQLPLGTANVLGHELGLPNRAEATADLVEAGAIRRLDLGSIDKDRFLLMVSSGFDAEVVRLISEGRSGALGYAGYVRPLLRALAAYRPPRLEVGLEGAAPIATELVAVCNVRNYGGLFQIADRARCDSGRLEVCLFTRARRRDVLRIAWAGLRARVSRLPRVEIRSARRIRIDSPEPVAVEVDGDYWGTTPVEIAVEPAVVPILVPKGWLPG